MCGLISLPKIPQIDLTGAVIGQKKLSVAPGASSTSAATKDNPPDVLKIVLPVLYGAHWCFWVLALVCLFSLRTSRPHYLQEPNTEFEIQDPKLPLSHQQEQQEQHRPHSLESTRSQHWHQHRSSLDNSSSSNNFRMSQHLLNFRQSVISPMGAPAPATAMTTSGSATISPSYPFVHHGKKIVPARFSTDSKVIQMPDLSYQGSTMATEKRASSESNAIYIPNDPRITQVVVTFKDENSDPAVTEPTNRTMTKVTEATTVYITNHNYAKGKNSSQQQDTAIVTTTTSQHVAIAGSSSRDNESQNTSNNGKDSYLLNFASSGESLSDMIFKQAEITGGSYAFSALSSSSKDMKQTQSSSSSSSAVHSPSRSFSLPTAALSSSFKTKNEDEKSIVGQVPDISVPNPARIRSTETKVSLTLSSDSSSSALSSLSSNTTTSLGSDSGSLAQQEGVVAGLAMVSVDPLNIVPNNKEYSGKPDSRYSIEHQQSTRVSAAFDSDSSGDAPVKDSSPGMQPNSSESSHSLSSILSSPPLARREEPRHQPQVVDRSYSSPPPPPSPLPRPVTTKGQPSTATAYVFPPRASTPSFPSRIPVSASNDTLPPLPPLHSVQTPASLNIIPPVLSTPVETSFTPVPSTPPSPVATTAPRKPSLASIPFQYWRNKAANAAANQGNDSSSSVSSSSSSFSQTLGQTFSKKKKFQIPKIVIHPDEEDGEPPRVLSDKDIEYLSMMPPPPLRPLIQPWDEEFAEDEEYDDNEGYDYDESFHPHHHHHQQQQQQQQIYHPQSVHPLDSVHEDTEDEEHELYGDEGNAFGSHDLPGCDPYALDVPIDLDMDLQTIQQGRRYPS
ncbi:hypothetical protein BGZ83_008575 [Gryganskiella cystojenkinii]|nr:hypothetical protein BGZ83_008575 [Gryganskiella cystojenkinii]